MKHTHPELESKLDNIDNQIFDLRDNHLKHIGETQEYQAKEQINQGKCLCELKGNVKVLLILVPSCFALLGGIMAAIKVFG